VSAVRGIFGLLGDVLLVRAGKGLDRQASIRVFDEDDYLDEKIGN